MNKVEVETHASHCCVLHGCKYSTKNCPVVKQKVKQQSPCENCEYDCDGKIPDPDDPNYDLYKMSEKQLRAEVIRLRNVIKRRP